MSEDTISRNAAIEAMSESLKRVFPEHRQIAEKCLNVLPSAQPERLTDYSFEESCTDCPAYDTENHRCPRFNQVIRRALKDANLEPCEDCISRQSAIDAIHCDITVTGRQNAELVATTIGAFADRIKALPSAQPEQRWIPCSERLPETHKAGNSVSGIFMESKPVLVYGVPEYESEYSFNVVTYCDDLNGNTYWSTEMDAVTINEVTAWMPLPEPYRAERRTDEKKDI